MVIIIINNNNNNNTIIITTTMKIPTVCLKVKEARWDSRERELETKIAELINQSQISSDQAPDQ
jgi:hypothetical protein